MVLVDSRSLRFKSITFWGKHYLEVVSCDMQLLIGIFQLIQMRVNYS